MDIHNRRNGESAGSWGAVSAKPGLLKGAVHLALQAENFYINLIKP